MLAKKGLMTAPAAVAQYVEDVFSTYLYTGNSSTQTITNNIDLSGEGGMTWIKCRNAAGTNNAVFDTVRGATKRLFTDLTDAQDTSSTSLTAFTTSGFTLGSNGNQNNSGDTFASWTFRKAEKFFDVVTYTGNGSNRTISHNLGSVPGCIIVRQLDQSANWVVYHRSLTATDRLLLNSTDAKVTSSTVWNNTEPTSSVFSVGTSVTTNDNGGSYVAYLFAHDAGGFGDAGDQNVITCGSYTGNGSAGLAATLGYEPQWVMVKCSSAAQTDGWIMVDTMRGFNNSANQWLKAQSSNAESAESARIIPTATGFTLSSNAAVNTNGATYIYIAIRRGPMKTPTTGTSVFAPVFGSSSGEYTATAGFPVDLAWYNSRAGGLGTFDFDRMRGNPYLDLQATSAETASTGKFDSNVNFRVDSTGNFSTWINWLFRRAPGFFDVVCYTGTGSATTVSHNLGVAPELMIVKRRSTTNAWAVYANNDNTDYLVLNTDAATVDDNTYWNDTSPTSSVFSVGTNNATNASGSTYVAYLFASVSGVSKVGSYTGNGSSVTVTTGFQPRFILVKRTDSTGNWIVSDSARGLVAGNDPYLLLNSTAAEDTDEDWVDISSTGFTVNQVTASNANVNTGTYIYLAIA